MTAFVRLGVLCVLACAQAQYAEERAPRYIASEPKAPATTPVPILKQINRHNEDGSYTYGYEGADGSFKIETKSPSGEVKGKYGYKDDTGKVRVVEYGANKFGFQPAGEGITVAPPTLVDESTRDEGLRPSKGQGSRNQYRPQPQEQSDYNDYDEPAPPPPPRPAPRPQQQYRPAPQQQPQPQYRPAPQQQPQPQYRPAPQPQPQPQYRPAPQPQQQYRPAPAPQPQPQQQYRPAPQSAPTPPKPQFFSGAAPAPSQDNYFAPQPAQRSYKPKQDFRPTPDYNNFAPAPASAPQPRYTSPQFEQPRNTQTFSMLDQLLKEYSLPANGAAPLHDITFGSY